MLGSPDGLDAVIAAFAAIAAVREGAPAEYPADRLIAVMDGGGSRSSRSVAAPPHNLLRAERECGEHESFEEVLRGPGVRIERIISRGRTTPIADPYVQDWDEWVLVLTGSARLKLDGSDERSLEAGAATGPPNPPPEKMAGELCSDRKDEPGDNGVGKPWSATLVEGSFHITTQIDATRSSLKTGRFSR
jgi:cupin 2 domain-containing protein